MKKVLLSIFVTFFAVSLTVLADGKSNYNSLGCAACHGPTGISVAPQYPNLAGQKPQYMIKQMKDFQSSARKDPTMNAMAALVAGKEEGIAEFLAAQK